MAPVAKGLQSVRERCSYENTKTHCTRVTALESGFSWNGRTFASLSAVARAITGVRWNGPRFFGLQENTRGQLSKSSKERNKEGHGREQAIAIYTRVSSDQGLEQDFNSLDARREAAEAYIKSQAHEGWRLRRDRYDDGGFSGGSMERPALSRLLADIREGRIDVGVVYKVDRLTRSLADSAARAKARLRRAECVVEPDGIEPTTSSMPLKRSPN
jgi:hypothetical protein